MKIAVCIGLVLTALGFGAVHAPWDDDECHGFDADGIPGIGPFHSRIAHFFPHHGMDIDAHLDKLGVTEEQKTAAAKILKSYGEQGHAMVDEFITARAELFKQVHADEFNETAIREASRRLAAVEEELAVLGARIIRDLRSILTPEQRERIKEMHPKMKDSIHDHISQIREKIQEWIHGHSAGK